MRRLRSPLQFSELPGHFLGILSHTLLLFARSVIMGNIRDTTRLDREITDLLVTTRQPDALLPAIVKKVGKAWEADGCWLVVNDRSGDNYQLYSGQNDLEASLPLVEICSLDLEDPLLINDPSTYSGSDLLRQALLELSIHSLVIAAAKLEGETIGYLVLASRQSDKWSVKERDRLKTILSGISMAIDKSQSDRKLRTLNHYQTILPELSTALAKSSDKEQFFRLALNSITEVLQADLGLVLLLKYDEVPPVKTSAPAIPKARVALAEEWIAPKRSHLSAKKSENDWNFALSECSLLAKAYERAPEPFIASDGNGTWSHSRLSSRYPDCSNWLILPLISLSREANSGGIVLGFIVLQHAQSRIWQPEEIALVSWIGSLTSTAIVQSQTLFQVQNLVEERTAQLQSSLEVQAKLYEKTRQQLEQVRQAKKSREEFIDSISHELRTPLTAMNLAIRMLRQPGLPDERRTNYFNILEQQCNQEIALVNDLLDWGRLEAKQFEVQVQTLNLRQLVDQLSPSFSDKWTYKGLKLELDFPPSPVELQTDRDILKRILVELLTNAGKYSLEGTTVSIKVDLSSVESEVRLTVTNIGSCIPDDEIVYIFEPLRRPAGTAKSAIRGTGLGLALVKSFVQNLHGAIAVSSHPVDGGAVCETSFTLTLPPTVENL